MIHRLSYEAVVHINHTVTGDCVVLNAGSLDSALAQPFQSAFYVDAYDTLVEKAAVLLAGIAAAHAFKDGNKRTAWTSCQTFLGMNGTHIRDDGTAGQLVLDLVEHRLTHQSAALWLVRRTIG